ncbi:hypothetical protein [Streptomyces yunnanensis]|uniref:Uncharacterized protein n=1 Tax=Streptomyces yunnanensis TaxID=156453 RepID=A0A9X8N8Z8_9ACTN|nr:hypothetical protein [Streptomyces yunnanensis]SHN31142.1 hypothetical protein SAMN05216268_13358 [Streptomyces yunnanensis]
MERISDNSGRLTPDSARSALDSVAASRARAATHIAAPWWYHVGLGAAVALVFSSMSLREASWVVPAFVVVVLGLDYAVRRATGVSFQRFTATLGAMRIFGWYVLAFVLLAAAGTYLEWRAGVPWAIAVTGGVVGVVTAAVGFRVDVIAGRDIRAGR